MMVLGFAKMMDNQGQQRQRRADGAVRSVADRSAVGENRALAPQTAQAPQGRPSVDREPSRVGSDSVDPAERCSLAGPAGDLSASFDVLETEKPSGARGRSGWWWSTAAVFLWETTFTLPPRRKSGSRKRRSRPSA